MDIINMNDKLFYVGGIVRDELLKGESLDIDIVYEGNAIEFVQSVKNIEILQVNEPFATVRIKINGKEVDLASTRSESYPKKGHLPSVENIGCALKTDMIRRDFTVNALAKNIQSGQIIDYVGGLKDLKNKKLRVLHDESFIDDPTRIVRGLKFSVRLGFELEEHTFFLQEEYLKNVNYDMSYKRLKDELISTFNLNSQKAFDKFIEQRIYRLFTEKDYQRKEVETIVLKYIEKVENVWLIYLGAMDLSRFDLTKDEKKILDDYKKITLNSPKTDYEIYKMFSDMKIESLLIYAVNNDKESVFKYLDSLRKVKLKITGEDIVKMGLPQSKKVGEILENVLAEKILNPQINYEDEINLVRKYL